MWKRLRIMTEFKGKLLYPLITFCECVVYWKKWQTRYLLWAKGFVWNRGERPDIKIHQGASFQGGSLSTDKNQRPSSVSLSHTLTCTHYTVKLTHTCVIASTAKVTENKTAWLMLLWQEMLQVDLAHYIYIPSLSPLSNCNLKWKERNLTFLTRILKSQLSKN